MQLEQIDGNILKDIIINAAENLNNNKKTVDDLNVFPVPDGDTGTNMSLTIKYAAEEINRTKETELSKIAELASSGALMGARGNSGVILSQLFRGFAKGCKDKKVLNISDLTKAMKDSSDMAYKAVMKPIEGTILTVAREMAEFALANKDRYKYIDELLYDVIKHGRRVLDSTPELLPVLKEAGVVDSGGMGLIFIVEGAYEVISGKKIVKETVPSDKAEKMFPDEIMTPEEITYGYCTEFIVLSGGSEQTISDFRESLSSIGDSVIVVGDENKIKVHVHTDNPDKALNYALSLGSLTRIKIENMREQVSNNKAQVARTSEKKFAFISVASGEGLENLFKSLGVDEIIQGGQTMNPSTQDFIDRIDNINAKNIIILPNNGNILLAANQAKEISDKNIAVVPTKSIPQGISALLAFNEEADLLENSENMSVAIQEVKTGQVTYAVRDTSFNSLEIKKGDIIGIIDGDLNSVGDDIYEVASKLIENMVDEDSSIISLYYGVDVERDRVEDYLEEIENKYPDLDVELNYGGQSLYYFIISVE